jgi:cytochrome P450
MFPYFGSMIQNHLVTTAIPRRKGHWLLGDMRALVQNPLAYISTHRQQLGEMFLADTLIHKVAFATHPDVAKHVLLDNHKNYYKSFDYDILKLVLGGGLIGSDGDFWRKQRRLAQPAFHKKRIEGMFQSDGHAAAQGCSAVLGVIFMGIGNIFCRILLARFPAFCACSMP